MWTRLAVVLAIVVTASCKTTVDVTIDNDDIVGCRAPTEAGCASCCLASDAFGANGNGYVIEDSSGTAQYVGTRNDVGNICPGGGLPACAKCSLQNEDDLRRLAAHPVCDCDGVDVGNDACESDACACYCQNLDTLTAACSD